MVTSCWASESYHHDYGPLEPGELVKLDYPLNDVLHDQIGVVFGLAGVGSFGEPYWSEGGWPVYNVYFLEHPHPRMSDESLGLDGSYCFSREKLVRVPLPAGWKLIEEGK